LLAQIASRLVSAGQPLSASARRRLDLTDRRVVQLRIKSNLVTKDSQINTQGKGGSMRVLSLYNGLLALLLVLPEPGISQVPQQKVTSVVEGFPGRAPVILVNGKSYVDIESLARLTNSSVRFQANQITLTLVTPVASPAVTQTDQPARLSKGLLQAGIEEMTAIGEWRTAIVNAVQNSNPVTEDGLDGYRRNADNKLAVASTTVVTDPDRIVVSLLRNEFNNMQKLGAQYLAMRKSLTYISPDSLDGDPLNQQIQNCARGLASLAASGQFQDVATCH
jgi:hypothetical protein